MIGAFNDAWQWSLASLPNPTGLVIVGVWADFYAACAHNSHLRAALQDTPLVVGPMSDSELRAAILYPAQDVGLEVEEDLVELLLRDLGDTAPTAGARGMARYPAGRLPLLAHALRICATTRNTLTPATWRQYVSPDLPYRPPCS